MSDYRGAVLLVEVGGVLIGVFLDGVLVDGLLLATVGGIFLCGVLAEDLLLTSAGDTFFGRILAEGLLLDTAGGIFLIVEMVLEGTPLTALLLSASSLSLSSLLSTSTRSGMGKSRDVRGTSWRSFSGSSALSAAASDEGFPSTISSSSAGKGRW